uniref:Carboxypeptidase n=1 Tax=Ixodes scapularis TaxID=6945 RepID=A0A4D5RLT6_IXOSC
MRVIVALWMFIVKETCTGKEPLSSTSPVNHTEDQQGNPGNQPLFLTPLIEAGRIGEAKSLSRVGPLGVVEDVLSYAGFLTVQRDMGSNMFFWFFPAKENPESAPVILWLQGGPGSSCMVGIFSEHGPFLVADGGIPKLREVTWTSRFSMLYVDSPVGTGFSFTGDRGYARNQTDVGRDMLEALQQFFTLFHELAGNDFYLIGESYAGKYVPAVAYAIHTAVQPRVRINLKGIAIGNGLVDPESMLDYADYLYQIGLVDRNQAVVLRQRCDEVKRFIQNERYADAVKTFNSILICGANSTCYFRNVTGFDNYFNFLQAKMPKDWNNFVEFVQTPVVRDAIHVGNLTFSEESKMVVTNLFVDLAKSVKPWLAALMEEYKVLIYNGQLDIIVPYPLTVNMISTVSWSGAEAFSNVPRQIWLSPNGQDVAGFVRQVGQFTEVLVRNAGHFVPYDQPEVALDMITRFVRGEAFDP